MNEAPRADRVHIGIFGRTNSGKSSFVNALTGQEISLVSEVRGTTTDPVYKSMEIHPIGASVLIDTAGFDDESILGEERMRATRRILDKTDVAVLLCSSMDLSKEKEWVELFKKHSIPIVVLANKMDDIDPVALCEKIKAELGLDAVAISAKNKENIDLAREKIAQSAEVERERTICGHLVEEGDIVLLVMPQDIQAPKGRLIMPQVQTIRDLLDHRCIVISSTLDQLKNAMDMLKEPPKLIITDSQIFPKVKAMQPKESTLTSFSVLFSRYKGDIETFVEGARSLGMLKAGDRVLIAEACTHNALDGDIGRIKIPNLLRKKYGAVEVEIVSGANFPEDLTGYSAIIHCGSCMFNRKHVMSRVQKAQEAGVPITNYGLAIAFMNDMMDSISY
ncbi:MAG: [FeFe] hydrogenase H-cluster maturation GTPase HydF [Peptostreptococcaceae bacterium]|nr:[FeFe] hydrogenase H-cluster maturation GTPase HydF [Peptostreptococcaceae bacterium]